MLISPRFHTLFPALLTAIGIYNCIVYFNIINNRFSCIIHGPVQLVNNNLRKRIVKHNGRGNAKVFDNPANGSNWDFERAPFEVTGEARATSRRSSRQPILGECAHLG